MGKKVDPSKRDKEEHVSRPLSTLKDPSLFGPPPKNVNYHGGAALPNEITPQTGGWGAPLSADQLSTAKSTASAPTQEEVEEEEDTQAGPPLPYRADRTGLRTDHLPPPPVHRDVNRNPEAVEARPARPQPRLPPRLPSRQHTASPPVTPPVVASPPPPAYESVPATQSIPQPSPSYGINQAAANRLGNAGVSVPALGIGSEQTSNPWRTEQSQTSQTSQPKSPPTNTQQPVNQLSELQARFARMNSSASVNSQQTVTPPFVTPAQSPAPASFSSQPSYITQGQPQSQTQGSTWAEKQSAMRTAQNAYKDPSSVSAQDATSAVRTANSFRDRHKDTIDAAGTRATALNKKYNVTGRLNSFLDKQNTSSPSTDTTPNGVNGNLSMGQQQVQGNIQPQQSPELTASISRKPPPPPPPKKPSSMHGSIGSMGVAPPPVPLGTKPSYS